MVPVTVTVPPRPSFWRRVGEGASQGLLIGIIIIGLLLVLSRFIGDSPLEKRVDRNAAITVAAEKGLRCILNEPDLPERGPERIAVFDRCYHEFDRLIRQGG